MRRILTITLILFGSAFLTLCEAQYHVLLNFNGTNGSTPWGDVTLSGKVLYGMTKDGGAHNIGCIFSVDTNGNNYKDLLDFDSANGRLPSGDLVLLGNKLFGMPITGGLNFDGCLFSIDTNGGGYRDLHDCSLSDRWPNGFFTFSGNKFFSMSAAGGGYGNVFSIDTNGTGYKNLLTFNQTNGDYPMGNVLLYQGVLYGLTEFGGASMPGNLFAIDTDGTRFRNLQYFTGSNGEDPTGSLVVSGKVLYGMTEYGGLLGDGCIFAVDTDGTNYHVLVQFNNLTGQYPQGSLTLSGPLLYGMTRAGAANGEGCIFSVDTDGGGYIILYNFAGPTGAQPLGTLTPSSGGIFYGMASEGGDFADGVVFKFDTNSATSIPDLHAKGSVVNVYPNPNAGQFAIQTTIAGGPLSVEVYNMLGEEIYSNPFTTYHSPFTIDLSSQPNGIYFYRVMAENGNLAGEGKLIIQK